jgi:hypothetical protein
MAVPFKNRTFTIKSRAATVASGSTTAVAYSGSSTVEAYFEEVSPSQAFERYGVELRRPAIAAVDPGDFSGDVGDRLEASGEAWTVEAIRRENSGLALDHDLIVLGAASSGY